MKSTFVVITAILLFHQTLSAQSYQHLSPKEKVAGQQAYILPKTSFIIEIPVITTTISRKSDYIDYSPEQLKSLEKKYGVDPEKYKKLKTDTTVTSNIITDDSIKFNIAAVPDYEKIIYISSNSAWNKNQSVTFTYGTDGILTDGESSREDKTFDIVVKGISGVVGIIGAIFKGSDGTIGENKVTDINNPKFDELDKALKNYTKLELINNYDIYKDMKSNLEKQYTTLFSEVFYSEKKIITTYKIVYTPNKDISLSTAKPKLIFPFFMLNPNGELVFSSSIKESLWGKDLKTEDLAGMKSYQLNFSLATDQQSDYFQNRPNNDQGIAFNIPQKIEFKLTNTDDKTVFNEICKVAQFGIIGYLNKKKKARVTFTLDPITGELKKLSLEGNAVLADQVGSATTLATDAVNTVKGEDADAKLEKEVKRLENEKKKRDLLKELDASE